MKSSSMNTHMGNISIDNEVIAQYAGSVAMECFGIVGMAGINVRDGVFGLLKKESMTRGINVSLTPEGKLVIDFHVIVSYGVNIPTVADNLIDSVRYKVEEFTGLESGVPYEPSREARERRSLWKDVVAHFRALDRRPPSHIPFFPDQGMAKLHFFSC